MRGWLRRSGSCRALRDVVGDVVRLVLGRGSHWSVGVLDPSHALIPPRIVDVSHYPSEEQAIADADRLAEDVAKLGPRSKARP